jgi:hypothetical protein
MTLGSVEWNDLVGFQYPLCAEKNTGQALFFDSGFSAGQTVSGIALHSITVTAQ